MRNLKLSERATVQATTLFQLAHAIRTNALEKLLRKAPTSIFHRVEQRVFDKLRDNLNFALHQIAHEGPLQRTTLADLCENMALRLCARHNVNVFKKDRERSLKSWREVETNFGFEALTRDSLSVFFDLRDANERDIQSVARFCFELGKWVTAINTLLFGSGCHTLDRVIARCVENTDYMVSGYPCDLLVFDVLERRHDELIRLYVHTKWCSTVAVKRNNPSLRPESDQYVYHYFEHKPLRKTA